MARGGKRPGAGRPPGAHNKRSRAIAEKAAKKGITPLEVMLDAMRHLHRKAYFDGAKKRAEPDDAMLREAAEIAKDAAPYMHPRLNAIQHTGKDGEPIQVTFSGLDAGAL